MDRLYGEGSKVRVTRPALGLSKRDGPTRDSEEHVSSRTLALGLSYRELLTRGFEEHVASRASAFGLPNREFEPRDSEEHVSFRALALGVLTRERPSPDSEEDVSVRALAWDSIRSFRHVTARSTFGRALALGLPARELLTRLTRGSEQHVSLRALAHGLPIRELLTRDSEEQVACRFPFETLMGSSQHGTLRSTFGLGRLPWTP